jgi:hypothetical protein
LKYPFLDVAQVAFLDDQNAENKFAELVEHKKYFLDLTQVAFWAGQNSENEFEGSVDLFKQRVST